MNELEIYRKTMEKYGAANQFMKLAEECNELSRAIIKMNMDRGRMLNEESFEAVCSEMADVSILMNQLELEFFASMMNQRRKKLQRLAERIENE